MLIGNSDSPPEGKKEGGRGHFFNHRRPLGWWDYLGSHILGDVRDGNVRLSGHQGALTKHASERVASASCVS
eukprot:5531741-Pyramimonas_sp.AAC.1